MLDVFQLVNGHRSQHIFSGGRLAEDLQLVLKLGAICLLLCVVLLEELLLFDHGQVDILQLIQLL